MVGRLSTLSLLLYSMRKPEQPNSNLSKKNYYEHRNEEMCFAIPVPTLIKYLSKCKRLQTTPAYHRLRL